MPSKITHFGQLASSQITTVGNDPSSEMDQKWRVGNRLREIRKAKGLTLQFVADAIGTTPTQISRLELSQRRLSDHWAERLAPVLGTRPSAMFSDDTVVPVVGYVGAGEEVHNFEDQAAIDYVKPPDGADGTAAVIVRGDSMWPKYEAGDLLFFAPTDHVNHDALGGKPCIVQVRNGPTYVKRVFLGSKPGLYRLTSYKAEDINDVDLLWASRVLWAQHK